MCPTVLMTSGFLSSYAAFSAKTVNEIRQERAFESQPPAIIVSVLRSSEIYTQFYLLFRAYYEGREKETFVPRQIRQNYVHLDASANLVNMVMMSF